jgi:NADP-dependent 3-hydroxy acid dehydrogenase YdfG
MTDVRRKTTCVSGAASGVGFGIVCALAQAGANVAMVDIRAEALAEAHARLHNFGALFASEVKRWDELVDTADIEPNQPFAPAATERLPA